MPSINGDFIDLDLPVSQTTSASHRDDSTSASQPAPSITSSIISPPAPRDAAEDAWKTDDKNGLDTRADFLDSDSEEIKNGMLKDIASPTGLPTRRGYKDDCKLIWDLFNIVSAPRSQMVQFPGFFNKRGSDAPVKAYIIFGQLQCKLLHLITGITLLDLRSGLPQTEKVG